MKWLMILWVVFPSFTTIPVLYQFDNRQQCEIVRNHITEMHGQYRGSECIPLDGKELSQ